MLSFVYQVQYRHHGKWSPYYPYKSSVPLEGTDLDRLHYEYQLLASRYDNLRLVKIETYLIDYADYK